MLAEKILPEKKISFIQKNIFVCLLSVHNLMRLSRNKQLPMFSEAMFHRYLLKYLSKHSLIKHTCYTVSHIKNGQKKRNPGERLKATRKNYIDKKKEKEGIFFEGGVFYYVYMSYNLVVYSCINNSTV